VIEAKPKQSTNGATFNHGRRKDFSRGGTIVVKFHFPHPKLRKQLFFAKTLTRKRKILKLRGPRTLLLTPMPSRSTSHARKAIQKDLVGIKH